MNNAAPAATPGGSTVNAPNIAAVVEARIERLSTLVEGLDQPIAPAPMASAADMAFEDHLVQARLGIASSLFAALRCKHAPTAAHCLRVALGCSSWALALKLSEADRDQVEIAALLHDVGKIGVPDNILLKPGALRPEEIGLLEQHRLAGLDILRSCSASSAVVEIVRLAPAWYDGSRARRVEHDGPLPLGARMLAVVDAFDSMTTDQVYRPAMSRERAMNELFAFAGTQFDPELVKTFSQLHESPALQEEVARRWLMQLDPKANNAHWQCNAIAPAAVVAQVGPEALFQHKLLDNMHDGVVFVDRSSQIMLWNRGAERLTGIAAASVAQRQWLPSLVGLRDENGTAVRDADCPVAYAIQTGVQSLRRMTIAGRNNRHIAADLHAVPVVGSDGMTYGAAVLLHDASPEASLEQRVHSLHERATKDPLTQVANRAEFDRTHEQFVTAHLERRLPCSLIICDIDHFKQINDVYGHQAGDEALKVFAQLLKRSCRPGDLVARYGGEEFVILCADCNNATAAQRAESMRKAISQTAQPSLSGKSFTVSFGVTEIQPGDTPETMLRRADRGLLEAKQRGRNQVVQLGSGIGDTEEKPKTKSRFSWWRTERMAGDTLLEKWLITSVPLNVAIEKLRGFVADHYAQVVKIGSDEIELQIEGERNPLGKRSAERAVPFLIELRFLEDSNKSVPLPAGRVQGTRCKVTIRPKRDRDRRRKDSTDRARYVFVGIKSYLMAIEDESPPDEASIKWAGALAPMFRQRDR